MFSRRRLLALGAAYVTAGQVASADESPATILTVSGTIDETGAAPRSFTLAALDGLPQSAFSTRCPWYPTANRFSGPSLRAVMAAVRATGSLLRISALDDYVAEIPMSDCSTYGPILATRRNGTPMPVSDKGPLFVIYPFDASESLRHQSFYSRSVWQVTGIDVR